MTPLPDGVSEALLAHYVAGDCTPAEVLEVERWLARDPSNHQALEDIRRIWAARDGKPAFDVDAMWQTVRRSIHEPSRPTRRSPTSLPVVQTFPKARWSRWTAFGLAAAAAISMVVFRPLKTPQVPASDTPPRAYTTQRGQQATIQLSDGSTLVLAPASRVEIPVDFGASAREVTLSGEAIFDVVHDTSRPFRVRSKHAVVEDIGTKFDVRAYESDSVVTVAVAEGIVALAQHSSGVEPSRAGAVAEGVVLREGDVGTLAPDGRVASEHDPDIARRFAWTSGRLEFTDARLADVLNVIGLWYDVDLRAAPELAGRRVTATFSINSPEQMVNALSLAVNADVRRTGSSIMLRSKP